MYVIQPLNVGCPHPKLLVEHIHFNQANPTDYKIVVHLVLLNSLSELSTSALIEFMIYAGILQLLWASLTARYKQGRSSICWLLDTTEMGITQEVVNWWKDA